MTTQQIIKINWKNAVRFYFTGKTSMELKACIKFHKEQEDNHFVEWEIRNSQAFKTAVNKLLNY